ncbi:MAG TPA: hypothetical protein VGF67_33005 [Ktedonobacteraceae bacterium]|jgi:predicted small secreted protein
MSVDTGNVQYRRCLLPAGMLVLVLFFLLAACGTNTTTGSPAGRGSVSSTPSPARSQISANGCPGKVVTARPAPANAVLTNKNSGGTIRVPRGETVEVDLPFGHAWSGPEPLPPGLLSMQTPVGYESPALGACVWRFIATGVGTAHLSFVGRPICGQGQVCPLYVLAVFFTLDIS